jgi:uncharacterized protein YndB with AHSA1/START domain
VISSGVIVHEVVYAHPVERVWRALVDSAELGVWLMLVDFVPVVGHRFRFDARPDFGWIEGEVLEVVEPVLLRCRWHGGPMRDTQVTFTLASEGASTRLRLEHRGWGDDEVGLRDGFDTGWAAKLTEALRQVLEGDTHHA